MSEAPVDRRASYLRLLKQGEAQGLQAARLGRYIAERLTTEEARAMCRDWIAAFNRPPRGE